MLRKKYTEEDILKAKTPSEYIERCLYSNVRSGEKAIISKVWQDRTGYTVEDIKYARNRHPYWKGRKLEGNTDRNRIRFKKYHFKDTPKCIWPLSKIKEFLKLNKKKDGVYVYKDKDIARMMESTLASVQAWRRKVNLINKLFDKLKTRLGKREEYLPLLMRSNEITLRQEVKKEKSSIIYLIKSQRSRK